MLIDPISEQLQEKLKNFVLKLVKESDEPDDQFLAKLEASSSAKIGPVKAAVKSYIGYDGQQRAPTCGLTPGLSVAMPKPPKRNGRGQRDLRPN